MPLLAIKTLFHKDCKMGSSLQTVIRISSRNLNFLQTSVLQLQSHTIGLQQCTIKDEWINNSASKWATEVRDMRLAGYMCDMLDLLWHKTTCITNNNFFVNNVISLPPVTISKWHLLPTSSPSIITRSSVIAVIHARYSTIPNT